MRFHDENYEGVVLKISTGFILTNPDLVKDLAKLYEALEKCQFSTMHPDHTRNLFELANYTDKTETRKERQRDERDRRDKQKTLMDKRLNADFIEITEEKYSCPSNLTYIRIGNKRIEDLFNRKSLKTSIKNEVDDWIRHATFPEFKEFLKENHFYLGGVMYLPEFDHTRCYIAMDSYGNISLHYYGERVTEYLRGKRNRSEIYTRSIWLEYDPETKQYFIRRKCFNGNLNEEIIESGLNTVYTFRNYKKTKHKFERL